MNELELIHTHIAAGQALASITQDALAQYIELWVRHVVTSRFPDAIGIIFDVEFEMEKGTPYPLTPTEIVVVSKNGRRRTVLDVYHELDLSDHFPEYIDAARLEAGPGELYWDREERQ